MIYYTTIDIILKLHNWCHILGKTHQSLSMFICLMLHNVGTCIARAQLLVLYKYHVNATCDED